MPDYSKTRIQLRRGTAAELASANPTLGVGEPAFETDTNVLKIGDGSTAYSSLSAISGGGGGGGGSSTFVGLSDTPANFTSAGSKFLKVNSGASALEFVAVSPLENVVEDTTPQLGGDLDINSNDITGTGNVTVVGTGTFVEIVKSGGTSSQFLKADGSVDSNTYVTSSINNIVEDTSPQLGGDLDTNGNDITGTGSINISGDLTTTGNNVNIGNANYGLGVSTSAATLGSNRLQLLGTETVLNQAGADIDFRVEGDTDVNLLFVDASTDRVGVGTSSPSSTLHVNGTMTATIVAKTGGASTEFLKADGSVDTNTYLTSVSNLDTTNFNSSNLVSESDSIASNDNDTTIPTSAAVKAYADTKLASDTSSIANSVAVNNVVLISQSNYDALGSYDANTLYFIT